MSSIKINVKWHKAVNRQSFDKVTNQLIKRADAHGSAPIRVGRGALGQIISAHLIRGMTKNIHHSRLVFFDDNYSSSPHLLVSIEMFFFCYRQGSVFVFIIVDENITDPYFIIRWTVFFKFTIYQKTHFVIILGKKNQA